MDSPSTHSRGLELSQELQAAVLAGDSAKLERLVANEFVLTGSPRLGVLGKREWIDAALNRFSWQRFEFGASTGFSADGIEVVSFFLEQQGQLGAVDVSGSFFAVDIWKRPDQRWQLVTRFATPTDDRQ